MKRQNELSKIALTAILLAFTNTSDGKIHDKEAPGIFLAAGCPNGCGSSTSITSNTATFSEPELLKLLSPQGKAIYQSLDKEGKTLAIQIASQESYRDKDLAVKEAQRRIIDIRVKAKRP